MSYEKLIKESIEHGERTKTIRINSEIRIMRIGRNQEIWDFTEELLKKLRELDK